MILLLFLFILIKEKLNNTFRSNMAVKPSSYCSISKHCDISQVYLPLILVKPLWFSIVPPWCLCVFKVSQSLLVLLMEYFHPDFFCGWLSKWEYRSRSNGMQFLFETGIFPYVRKEMRNKSFLYQSKTAFSKCLLLCSSANMIRVMRSSLLPGVKMVIIWEYSNVSRSLFD